MKKSFFLLLLLGQVALAFGQQTPRAESWQTWFFDAPERTLPLLAEAAARHSAVLATGQTDKAIAREDIQLARKAILNSVQLSGNYGYGNLASVTVGDQSLPSAFTTSSQTRYLAGVNFNLPLDRVVGRRNEVSRQRLQYQKAEHQLQAQEDLLRQRVIDLYQAVLLAHKVLALRQQAYLSAQVNAQLAERQFRQGETTLAEYAQLNDRYLTAAVEQENATNTYETAFLLLEDVTGEKISALMTRP